MKIFGLGLPELLIILALIASFIILIIAVVAAQKKPAQKRTEAYQRIALLSQHFLLS